MTNSAKTLFCQCKYADVVPQETREAALASLTSQDIDFTAVPDLCEASVYQKDLLRDACGGKGLTVIACYPRAVQALLESADVTVDPNATRWINMRELKPCEIETKLNATKSETP